MISDSHMNMEIVYRITKVELAHINTMIKRYCKRSLDTRAAFHYAANESINKHSLGLNNALLWSHLLSC